MNGMPYRRADIRDIRFRLWITPAPTIHQMAANSLSPLWINPVSIVYIHCLEQAFGQPYCRLVPVYRWAGGAVKVSVKASLSCIHVLFCSYKDFCEVMMMGVTLTGMHLDIFSRFHFYFSSSISKFGLTMCYSVVNKSFHDKEDGYIWMGSFSLEIDLKWGPSLSPTIFYWIIWFELFPTSTSGPERKIKG